MSNKTVLPARSNPFFYLLIYIVSTISCNVNAELTANNQSKQDSLFMSLASTPPMGWNCWNKFGCNVSEQLILEMADAMVNSGMKQCGYQYIVIDDCWQTGRDEQGNILADARHFRHGIKYLADEIHKHGLKLGIYSCGGIAYLPGTARKPWLPVSGCPAICTMGRGLSKV